MRFTFIGLLLFIATLASSQEMFNQPVRLSSGDSVTINVSEVYVAYEQTDGSSKLAYSYPNSTILLRTDFDDLIANSCGNLVKVSVLQPGGVQEVGINPQYTYRVYRVSGKTKIQIRNTNQVFESPQSFAEVSALLGNCGAASAVSIDSVTVANDTICIYYNDATFDCFDLTDTLTATNWYSSNGSTTDSLRFARIIKSAIWLGMDTTGLIRHQVGTLDGSRNTVYQDSTTLMKFGSDATNYVSVGRDRINIVTSGDEGAIRLRSDTINFFDKYLFANATPLSTNGIMSFHYWRGNGTSTTPGFTTMSVLADSISGYLIEPDTNIYVVDGTQDDADRLFTQDSTRTFAMGQFSSVSSPTWGRGYYYDPSTANGIRLLNKDNTNTSQTKVELDPTSIQIKSDFSNADATYDIVGLSENASHVLTADRTSDTYGELNIAALTNTSEEQVALRQAGKTTAPAVVMYLGDGYVGSQYGEYVDRAWGLQSKITGGGFDWLQVLLPDTGTDTTGNNLNFYNRKYYWSNSTPTSTNGVMSFHRWTGNGTTTDPGFITMSALADSISDYAYEPDSNIYTVNGTTGTNRTVSIGDNLNFVNNSAATGERFNVTFDNGVSSTNFFRVQEGTGILLQSSENIISLEGATALSDVVSPTTLASNTNDYTGLNGSNFGRLTASPSVNLTGIANGRPGRILPFYNVSTSNYITLKDNVTSTALNRFEMQTDLNLKPNDGALFIYDSVTQRHRLLATSVGSPYTGSGQLLNGRSGSLYMSYMQDTLNDFALGYFTNGTTDDRTTYGKFGLHIDGAAGFSVQGKETYIKGTLFNLLGTGYMTANGYGYEMEGLSRISTGASSSSRISFAGNTLFNTSTSTTYSENGFKTSHVNDLYDELSVGTFKQLEGIPQDRQDYGYLYQGGGQTGADTSAISMWWGIPQYTDTVLSITNGSTRAISKERGFGVQSLFDYNAGGVQASFKYDWLKIRTGSVPGDTAVHSSSNDGITFYGHSYEIPNETPSSAAGDTSIMVWTDRFNSFFIDKSEFCCGAVSGGSVNIYNSDGNLQNGGSQMLMDTLGETLRLKSDLDATTTREMMIMEVMDDATTRFMVLKSQEDSLRLFRSGSGRQYTMQAYGGTAMSLAGDSTIIFTADSILYSEGILDTKTKAKHIMGLTTGNYGVRFDGDAASAGDVLVSNGTDWTVGSLGAQETNAPATIRPAQLTAKMDDWTPTDYSTTKTQIIELSGDGSFRFITGMAAATRDGVMKTLENEGATNCVGIAKKHTGSTAANRFDIPTDVILLPGMAATFRYDSIGAAWKLVSTTEANVYFPAMYDINTAKTGNIISDNFYYDGQTAGGTITRSSAGIVSNSKITTTNFSTSTAAGASPCLLGYAGNATLTANSLYVRSFARVRFEDLSTAAENYDFTFGYGEYSGIDTLARTKEGFFITYTESENSGAFSLWTHNGTTGTSTQMGSAIAADTWYELELIYYPYGEVTAYIDGTRYTTTTTVTTAATLSYMFMIDKDNGTTARIVYTTGLQDKIVHVAE